MRCLTPFTVKRNGTSDRIQVRCGNCEGCRATYKNDLTERCKWVHKHCSSAVFLTLTVSEENLEYVEVLNEETGEVKKLETVSKKRLHAFNRRIKYNDNKNRKAEPVKLYHNIDWGKLTYIQSAEYGENTLRQHYHSLYWNLHPKTESQLQEIWPYGHVEILEANEGAINYIIRHQVKAKGQTFHENQQKPFLTKSINLGADMAQIAEGYIKARHNKISSKKTSAKTYSQYIKGKLDLPKMSIHSLKKLDYLQMEEDIKHLKETGEEKLTSERRKHELKERFSEWLSVGKKKI